MTQKLETVLNTALQLSDEERAILVDSLIESLSGTAEDGVEEAWAEEIAKRSAEYQSGLVQPVPWTQVREDVRRKLGLTNA